MYAFKIVVSTLVVLFMFILVWLGFKDKKYRAAIWIAILQMACLFAIWG